ncbi:MAG: hypothetical protein NT079_03855 [Candidatus Omnitrophica bacterium]|nr:hypothetical protein [Candidatus Omnitrophota bacterium]
MNSIKTIVAVIAIVFFAGISVCVAQTADVVRHVPGEITWIDLKLGALQFEQDVSPRTGEITEYRINKDETRVTDSTDKKFLTVADLQPGQHVIIDVINGKEENIVKKITADPKPTPNLQEAYGRIEAIDVTVGEQSIVFRF